MKILFLNNSFKAIISVDKDNNIFGKVIDLDFNEEYTPLKTEMNGSYVNNVRREYENILLDIKDKVCNSSYFIFDKSNEINNYIKEKYNINPEFLWEKNPGFGIYRKKSSSKWFSLIMNIDYKVIDNSKSGEIEIMNLKLDPDEIDELIKKDNFYEAYHMSKKYWITVVLNSDVDFDLLTKLVDKSYNNVK